MTMTNDFYRKIVSEHEWDHDRYNQSLGSSSQYMGRKAEYFKKKGRSSQVYQGGEGFVEIRICNTKNDYTGQVGTVTKAEFDARPTGKKEEIEWAISHCIDVAKNNA